MAQWYQVHTDKMTKEREYFIIDWADIVTAQRIHTCLCKLEWHQNIYENHDVGWCLHTPADN